MAGLKRCLSALALVTLVVGRSLAAASQPLAVVLASTAPGYATGQVLATAEVTVPDGANTVFLLPSGQVITINGPYSGRVENRQPSSREQNLAQLLAPGQDRSGFGGSRSMELGLADDRLEIDPAQNGVYCITPHTDIVLTRPTDPSFDRIRLRSTVNGATVDLDWTTTAVQAWPTALPLRAGMVQVRSNRTGAKRLLDLLSWSEPGTGDAARAAGLALAGCRSQASAALSRLRDVVAPLDLYLDSSRGRFPTYHVGEPVELILRANRDAYLYCLLRDRDGNLSQLFPWQASEARIAGDQTLRLPGRWLPVGLRARAELNGSEVRCFASERDLGTELPMLVGGSAGVPLPADAAAALDRAIVTAAHGRVVTEQLILRVEG